MSDHIEVSMSGYNAMMDAVAAANEFEDALEETSICDGCHGIGTYPKCDTENSCGEDCPIGNAIEHIRAVKSEKDFGKAVGK